jgi:hypothetical protein
MEVGVRGGNGWSVEGERDAGRSRHNGFVVI